MSGDLENNDRDSQEDMEEGSDVGEGPDDDIYTGNEVILDADGDCVKIPGLSIGLRSNLYNYLSFGTVLGNTSGL